MLSSAIIAHLFSPWNAINQNQSRGYKHKQSTNRCQVINICSKGSKANINDKPSRIFFSPGFFTIFLRQVITDKIRDDDEAGSVENDWKFAAMVIDRLCLIGK